jgi:hypothetical protein
VGLGENCQHKRYFYLISFMEIHSLYSMLKVTEEWSEIFMPIEQHRIRIEELKTGLNNAITRWDGLGVEDINNRLNKVRLELVTEINEDNTLSGEESESLKVELYSIVSVTEETLKARRAPPPPSTPPPSNDTTVDEEPRVELTSNDGVLTEAKKPSKKEIKQKKEDDYQTALKDLDSKIAELKGKPKESAGDNPDLINMLKYAELCRRDLVDMKFGLDRWVGPSAKDAEGKKVQLGDLTQGLNLLSKGLDVAKGKEADADINQQIDAHMNKFPIGTQYQKNSKLFWNVVKVLAIAVVVAMAIGLCIHFPFAIPFVAHLFVSSTGFSMAGTLASMSSFGATAGAFFVGAGNAIVSFSAAIGLTGGVNAAIVAPTTAAVVAPTVAAVGAPAAGVLLGSAAVAGAAGVVYGIKKGAPIVSEGADWAKETGGNAVKKVGQGLADTRTAVSAKLAVANSGLRTKFGALDETQQATAKDERSQLLPTPPKSPGN